MKIRGKLVCSFLMITLLPTILFFGAVKLIYQIQVQAVMELEGEFTSVTTIFANPIQSMNKMTEGEFAKLKKQAVACVENLEDEAWLDQCNTSLLQRFSFLLVKKEDTYIYVGDQRGASYVEKDLPGIEQMDEAVGEGIYIGGENAFLVKGFSIIDSEGKNYTVYLVTLVSGWLATVKSVFVQIICSFLAIILLTAAILILWVYRGIVHPINVLKNATHRMRDGDLDFSIETNSVDEIGMLCRDFEEMRVRLKESIELRLNYEEEMRGLMSNISHDLKTPLTAIEGYTEGILDGVAKTPEKQEKYLRTIYTKAKEMDRLVDELSMSAKLENGTVPYAFRRVLVGEYFGDCVDELREELGLRGITLVYENRTRKDACMEVDPEQLKRVINNLVSNSIKYFDKKEKQIMLTISEEEEGELRVVFKDNGKGIGKEALPHVFERFYREDTARQSKTGGSGLGLAIVAKIIEEHGGKIWAESVEGEGTTIIFQLRECLEVVTKNTGKERRI